MKWNCKDWSSTGECYDEFWTLNEDHDRMEMRGFLMRESTPDPFSGEYTPLAGPPKDGDVVRLCARVYNYALFSPANNFHVLFEYIPIDQAADEIGSRVVIGKVSTNLAEIENSDSVHNPSMKEVCVNWDTTGLGQSQYTYRFYVTVDPDNEVKNELHEWKEADGTMCIHGNNEGYWPWGAGMPVLTPEVPGKEPAPHDIFITKKSLCLLQNNKFTSGSACVQAGQKYKLRAQIHSTHDRSPFHYVVFSEGPPVEGNEFAVKMAGIIKGDSYVWADWTPKEPGIKRLYVHIAEHLGDTRVGNNFDSLFVEVQDFPIITPTPIPVTIDIKPGSKPNSINLKSNGTIPVAVLSSAKFHAPGMVNRGSLSFGQTGEEESLAFCNHRGKDLNGDGLKDLICHFYTENTGFECGDTDGILKGVTIDNKPIEGVDSVRIVPCKKQANHNSWKWSQGKNWHCP